jgi:hypothetical protein
MTKTDNRPKPSGALLAEHIHRLLFDSFFDSADHNEWLDAGQIATKFMEWWGGSQTREVWLGYTAHIADLLNESDEVKPYVTRWEDSPCSLYPVYQINRRGIVNFIKNNSMKNYF